MYCVFEINICYNKYRLGSTLSLMYSKGENNANYIPLNASSL